MDYIEKRIRRGGGERDLGDGAVLRAAPVVGAYAADICVCSHVGPVSPQQGASLGSEGLRKLAEYAIELAEMIEDEKRVAERMA